MQCLEAATHPTVHRTALCPQQETLQSKMPRVPRLRNTHPNNLHCSHTLPTAIQGLEGLCLVQPARNEQDFPCPALNQKWCCPPFLPWTFSSDLPKPWAPAATICQPTFPTLGSSSFGTVHAVGPEGLGTFLTFALVSYSSGQQVAGLQHPNPRPHKLKHSTVLTTPLPRLFPFCTLPWGGYLHLSKVY
jgi:hypothetical protein